MKQSTREGHSHSVRVTEYRDSSGQQPTRFRAAFDDYKPGDPEAWGRTQEEAVSQLCSQVGLELKP
jgi:hypothetical protein